MLGMPPLRMGVDIIPMTELDPVKTPWCYDPTHVPVYSEWLYKGKFFDPEPGEYVFVREWENIAELVEYAHGCLDGILIKENGHPVMEIW